MRVESGGRSDLEGRPADHQLGWGPGADAGDARHLGGGAAPEHGLGRDPLRPREQHHGGHGLYPRAVRDVRVAGLPRRLQRLAPAATGNMSRTRRSLPPETQRYIDIISPQIAGTSPGSSRPDRMTQYAEQQIQDLVDDAVAARTGQPGSRSPVVMAMAPILDRLSPDEQGTMARVDAAIADRTGRPLAAQPASIRQASLPAPASARWWWRCSRSRTGWRRCRSRSRRSAGRRRARARQDGADPGPAAGRAGRRRAAGDGGLAARTAGPGSSRCDPAGRPAAGPAGQGSAPGPSNT